MALTYLDEVTGRTRVKRRYVWAFWGYVAGAASMLILVALLP